MSVHEQYGEDLALYALGCLEGGERASLEKHLEECASCRRELEQLRGDTALLALAAAGPRPPARARTRLMNAVAKEPLAQRARPRLQWWAIFGWVVAVLVIGVLGALWKQNTRLRANAVRSVETLEKQRLQLEKARVIVETLTASDAQHVVVLPVGTTAPPPEGKAIYSREHNGLIFMASNLRPLPAQKAYELWLIPTQGAPIPAGVFKPDAHGGAMVINPPLPAGVEAKAFAITIEPEQGSSTPTLPIVMMGAGG